MRLVVCLVIGLLVGAISAATLASIMSQRNAYPRALMRVLQHQLGSARDAAREQACEGNPGRLAMLDPLASDIASAFAPDAGRERVFRQYVEDLRRQVDRARQEHGGCAAQNQALADIANACEACHRDYR